VPHGPVVVRASAKPADTHLSYIATDDGYLWVVTAKRDRDDRLVVTAYYTRNIKKGKELWRK
jgi:hypothetical protein